MPNDGAEGDRFGGAVAISGNTIVVGARFDDDNGDRSGAAYLFDATTGQQIAKLLPEQGEEYDAFGASVAINENIVAIGAMYDDINGMWTGSVYLFDATTGEQTGFLFPEDGESSDLFGKSIAISGTTVLVGAPFDNEIGLSSGSAYLFNAVTGQLITKLLPTDGQEFDYFGESVALSGTHALVGSWADDDNGYSSGSAYLFDASTGEQIAKLLPNDGYPSEFFGYSVAIDGNTALIGAPMDDNFATNTGSAYVFDISTGHQIAKLLPSDVEPLGLFGSAVAISGNMIVVGAWAHDINGESSGAAYLFDCMSGEQIARLLPSDGSADDVFGISVAIDHTTIVAGAEWGSELAVDSGTAYILSTPCSADLTGGGSLDFFDVSAFLTAYAANDPTADFNADGSFNFFDISAFLVAYLAGCP